MDCGILRIARQLKIGLQTIVFWVINPAEILPNASILPLL
jgi:hypothetical protein